MCWFSGKLTELDEGLRLIVLKGMLIKVKNSSQNFIYPYFCYDEIIEERYCLTVNGQQHHAVAGVAGIVASKLL